MNSSQSRRQFLQGSAAIFLTAAASHTKLNEAQSISSNSEENYWSIVRSQFAFDESAVPMNAANLCPSFRSVSETVAALTYDIDRDCSFNNRAKFNALAEESRTAVANQINVSADEVALVRNTSEANNIINNGLALESGDEVILWDQNHPTNNIAWDVRASRYGLNIKKIATSADPENSQELIDTFVSHFSNRTRVLSLTHVSNVSGIKLPIKQLVEAAHSRNIYVHVDGAQVWGAMALDLRDSNVDSFSASAHKWFMGPKEVGLLYVKESNIDRIWPNIVAPGWGDEVDTVLKGARKFESLGQRDDSALAGIGIAAHQHDLISTERVEARVVSLSQRLKEGITELGLELVTPMDPELSYGVCITRAPTGQGGTITDLLYRDHGIAGAATGGIRLCPTIYNTHDHIDRAIAGLKKLMT
ncbi:MAG: aminotransferase class V-fold PLP-dependent enzyme [Gammaproteobacteria bacterium]|nr:aminotransferase class V-fold PLP-dependent enzyme [Gammaproteobacteria bacterium]